MTFKRKLASVLTAGAMVALTCAPAYAGTINVPTDINETYTAYKILDVTGTGSARAYSIASGSAWLAVLQSSEQQWLDLTQSADQTKYVVTLKSGVADNETTARAIANYLMAHLPADATTTSISKGPNTVDNGYYLISSTMGSNLAIVTTDESVNLGTKNTYPTFNKTITVGDTDVKSTTASIGDTINYKIVVNIPASVDKSVTIHDQMEGSLTMTSAGVSVTAENGDAISGVVNTNPADQDSFEVVIPASYKGSTVTISYSAVLNASATTGNGNTNDNTAQLTYSGFVSEPDTVSVSTYQFGLFKYTMNGTDEEMLPGATFQIKGSDGNAIKFVALTNDDGGITGYRPVVGTESGSVDVVAGDVDIIGLGNDTYTVTETQAPAGYNLATTSNEVVINGDNQGDVRVLNQTGTELPSTGGMGTTIFYIIGGILVVAAGVTLVVRRRSRED